MGSQKMRILLTGASKPPALALARVLHAEGHDVLGVDSESVWGLTPARYSKAYTRFYSYAEVHKKLGYGTIDLAIPFDDASNLRSLTAKATRTVYQPLFEDASAFYTFVRSHVPPSPIKVPALFTVHSQDQVAEILSYYPYTSFQLEACPPSATYDPDLDNDSDTLVGTPFSPNFRDSACFVGYPQRAARQSSDTLLISLASLDDDVVRNINAMPISEHIPYRLVEVVSGGKEYSAHALTHGSDLQTFVVTTPTQLLEGKSQPGTFTAVSRAEPIFETLQDFMHDFAKALHGASGGSDGFTPTTHLNIKFHVKEVVRGQELLRRVIALSCTQTPHDSLVLLCASSPRCIATAYADPKRRAVSEEGPVMLAEVPHPRGVYSLPIMLDELSSILWGFFWLQALSLVELANVLVSVCAWLLLFREDKWDSNDPGPALCEWFMKLPLEASILFLKRLQEIWEDGLTGGW